MRIKDIEPYIDEMKLKKLEVKLSHNQVHFFICAVVNVETEDWVYGDLVVFDEYGQGWKCDDTRWPANDPQFHITEFPGYGMPISAYIINNEILSRERTLDFKIK